MYRDHNSIEQVFSGSKYGMIHFVNNEIVFSFAILRIRRFCNLFKARHLWNGWGRDRWTWKADAGHPLCNQVIPFVIVNIVGISLKRQKNHITNHDINLSQVSQRHERQPWKDKVPCSPFYRPSSRCHQAKHQGIYSCRAMSLQYKVDRPIQSSKSSGKGIEPKGRQRHRDGTTCE